MDFLGMPANIFIYSHFYGNFYVIRINMEGNRNVINVSDITWLYTADTSMISLRTKLSLFHIVNAVQ